MSCPNKELCGSCSWSHIPYEKQLEQKLADINYAFKLKQLNISCNEIIPSEKKSHYRNRMDFVINFEGKFGLREKSKWWKVIDGHTCFLASEGIEETFHKVKSWLKTSKLSFYDRKTYLGFLRYAVIRETSLKEKLVNIITSKPVSNIESEQALSSFDQLSKILNVKSFYWTTCNTTADISRGEESQLISGDNNILEQILDYNYIISPQAFFQTNSFTAEQLLKTAGDFLNPFFSSNLLDLYCGSGFFSIYLAKNFTNIVGIEEHEQAIVDAKENAKLNNLKIEYLVSKTENIDWKIYKPDVIIVDPPRSGLHPKALQELIGYQPKALLYISCNYKNFARELVELTSMFKVSKIKAIDMFPHTPHVELISLLEPK